MLFLQRTAINFGIISAQVIRIVVQDYVSAEMITVGKTVFASRCVIHFGTINVRMIQSVAPISVSEEMIIAGKMVFVNHHRNQMKVKRKESKRHTVLLLSMEWIFVF